MGPVESLEHKGRAGGLEALALVADKGSTERAKASATKVLLHFHLQGVPYVRFISIDLEKRDTGHPAASSGTRPRAKDQGFACCAFFAEPGAFELFILLICSKQLWLLSLQATPAGLCRRQGRAGGSGRTNGPWAPVRAPDGSAGCRGGRRG